MSKNQIEIQILKYFYAALNSGDVEAAVQLCDPQIERVEFIEHPTGSTHHGHEEMRAHIKQGRDTWAEGGCHPEQFMTNGEKTVVLVHVLVRLKNKTDWIDGCTADGFTFRNGKILLMRSFMEKQLALNWAGLKNS